MKLIITSECKQFLEKCEDLEIISKDKKRTVEYCCNHMLLKEGLCGIYNIDSQRILKIWGYIIDFYWENVKKEKLESFFNEHENYFMRELLRNNGYLSRSKFKEHFESDYLCDNTAEDLMEEKRWKNNIVPICKISIGTEVIFMLHPKFYSEVLKHE